MILNQNLINSFVDDTNEQKQTVSPMLIGTVSKIVTAENEDELVYVKLDGSEVEVPIESLTQYNNIMKVPFELSVGDRVSARIQNNQLVLLGNLSTTTICATGDTIKDIGDELDSNAESVNNLSDDLAEQQAVLTDLMNKTIGDDDVSLINQIIEQNDELAKLLNLANQIATVNNDNTGYNINVRLSDYMSDGISEGAKINTVEKNFTFDVNGLNISSTNADSLRNRIDETGMYVSYATNDRLIANAEGVNAYNLKANNYLIICSHTRFQDYVDSNGDARTACFYIA